MKQQLSSLLFSLPIIAVCLAPATAQSATPEPNPEPATDIQARVKSDVAKIEQAMQSCIAHDISPDQFYSDAMRIINALQTEGLIEGNDAAQLSVGLQNNADKCRAIQNYQEQTRASILAFGQGQITADALRTKHKAMLDSLMQANYISEEEYNDTLKTMDENIAEFERSQAANQAQLTNTEPQAAPAQGETQTPAASPVEEFQKQIIQLNADYIDEKCNDNQYKERYTHLMDEMLQKGIISQNDRDQMVNSVAQNLEKAQKYRWFKKEADKLKERQNSGRMPIRRWKSESIELVDKMENDKAFSHEEASQLREQIQASADNYMNTTVTAVNVYNANQFGAYYSHTEYRTMYDNNQRPDAFQLNVGINGGAIFDSMSSWDKYHDEKYDTESFWQSRADNETLAFAGLHLQIGYIWRWSNAFPFGFGLMLRQDFNYAFWFGDTADAYDNVLMGFTTAVFRLEFSAWDATLRFPMDFGFGIAYGSGDARSKRDESGYQPAYFFNAELDSAVNFAMSFGLSMEYFITDYVGLGLSFNVFWTISNVTVDSSEPYSIYAAHPDDATFGHSAFVLQPDLHVIVEF